MELYQILTIFGAFLAIAFAPAASADIAEIDRLQAQLVNGKRPANLEKRLKREHSLSESHLAKLHAKGLDDKQITIAARFAKASFLGVAAGKFYDGMKFLWGLEFRDLFVGMPEELAGALLDSSQIRMNNSDFGIPAEHVKYIYEDPMFGDKAYYFPTVRSQLFREKDMPCTRLFPDGKFKVEEVTQTLAKTMAENQLIGLLVKRYQYDTVIGPNPKLLAKVEEVQRTALRYIENGADPHETLRWFIERSGLVHHYASTLIYSYRPSMLEDLNQAQQVQRARAD